MKFPLYLFLLLALSACSGGVAKLNEVINRTGNPAPSATPVATPTPAPTVVPVATPTPAPTIGPSVVTIHPLSTLAEFRNPERGFSRYRSFSSFNTSAANSVVNANMTLAGMHIDMGAYVNTATLPQTFLNQYQAMFNIARNTGIKLILTHRYHRNHDLVSDPTQAIILGHVNQLLPIMNANADVILNIHTGFIGAYGEMYYTPHRNDLAFRRTLVHTLLNGLPSYLHVSLRYPGAKVKLYNMTQPNVVQNPADLALSKRVSHWNDCFVSSPSDVGTTLDYNLNNPSDWRDFVGIEAKANALPVGGETCAVSLPHSACANTLVQLSRQAWTYMNHDYHEDVIAGWQSGGCYNELRRNLGYRLRVNEIKLPVSVSKTSSLNLDMKIENVGYSAPVHPRPVKLVLFNTQNTYRLDLNVNPVLWKSGIHTVTKSLSLSSVSPGTYQVALWLPDQASGLQSNPAYSIRLANENNWDAAQGWNVIKNGSTNVQVTVTP